MIDKKDYIIKQLHRARNKKFENYVITRIWHFLDDLDIKFVTQQYIVRPNGYALADLFFPQFNIIVEVDEAYHLGQKIADNMREKDIINAANFKIIRVDTSKSIESIHSQTDDIVTVIKELKATGYQKWDYEKEFDIQQYINKGYIDLDDNAVFLKSVDACNCFSANYKGWQRGEAPHKFRRNTTLWFPKLYEGGEWGNKINLNEDLILESNEEADKNEGQLNNLLGGSEKIRYVFSHTKDNLGTTLYRFKGEFTLNKERTVEMRKAVWERTNTRVDTINIKK